jgi:hypothetical protein
VQEVRNRAPFFFWERLHTWVFGDVLAESQVSPVPC